MSAFFPILDCKRTFVLDLVKPHHGKCNTMTDATAVLRTLADSIAIPIPSFGHLPSLENIIDSLQTKAGDLACGLHPPRTKTSERLGHGRWWLPEQYLA